MMKFFTFLFLLVGLGTVNSQSIIIECPEDQLVHLFDLDDSFTSYGSPQVNSPENYQVDNTITIIDGGCERYATLRYTATSETGLTAWCEQRITIDLPTLGDVTFPADFLELTGVSNDTEPEVAGYPEPYEFLNGDSNIFATYDDLVLPNSTGVKVLRTWTLLDWCTGASSTHRQVITIDNLLDGEPRLFNATTCAGAPIGVSYIAVSTTQAGFTVDQSACTFNNSLADYLNCLAENNDINSGESFIVELSNENEDYLNGVSTLDIVFSQRHILGVQPIFDFCSLSAADVNGDERISALDVLLMRKLILGIDSEFAIPSWLFFNDSVLDDNASPRDKDLEFEKSEFPLQDINILAVKVGDLNGTAAGN